ncbi:amidohydrolase family protein [Halovenus marina]|uniref:amidohydrolase family protein n=1 Tax=Halovenus marina TaxID=3396621 RepID=UPI003F5440DC
MEYPHSPDVEERELLEDGFSAGWGAHHQPSERYWIDCHTHMLETEAGSVVDVIEDWTDYLNAWRFAGAVGVDGRPAVIDEFEIADRETDHFQWMSRLDYDNPSMDAIGSSLEAGACGLKLHNKPLIEAGEPPSKWQDPEWHDVFDRLETADLPVFWHVTQRLTDAPYIGQGRNKNWNQVSNSDTNYTNEDLLQSFIEIVEEYPDTDFIGAHQLHLGFDRLAKLFELYPNLYIDTSAGFFIRWGDRIYPQDRDRVREFVMNWSDRILFGTDCALHGDVQTANLRQQFLGHVRFIRQLNLPDNELQQISHLNAERLLNLEHVRDTGGDGVRP